MIQLSASHPQTSYFLFIICQSYFFYLEGAFILSFFLGFSSAFIFDWLVHFFPSCRAGAIFNWTFSVGHCLLALITAHCTDILSWSFRQMRPLPKQLLFLRGRTFHWHIVHIEWHFGLFKSRLHHFYVSFRQLYIFVHLLHDWALDQFWFLCVISAPIKRKIHPLVSDVASFTCHFHTDYFLSRLYFRCYFLDLEELPPVPCFSLTEQILVFGLTPTISYTWAPAVEWRTTNHVWAAGERPTSLSSATLTIPQASTTENIGTSLK